MFFDCRSLLISRFRIRLPARAPVVLPAFAHQGFWNAQMMVVITASLRRLTNGTSQNKSMAARAFR